MPVGSSDGFARSDILRAALCNRATVYLPARVQGTGEGGQRPLGRVARADSPDACAYAFLRLFPDQPAARKGSVIEMWGNVNPMHIYIFTMSSPFLATSLAWCYDGSLGVALVLGVGRTPYA